jgi:hypothetical protein
VLPKKHGQFQLLLFHEPLRGDGYLAPALHFLIGFDGQAARWRRPWNGLRLGGSDLRHADGAALHFRNFTAATQSQNCVAAASWVLPGLGNPDVRARSASSDRCSSAFFGFVISPRRAERTRREGLADCRY